MLGITGTFTTDRTMSVLSPDGTIDTGGHNLTLTRGIVGDGQLTKSSAGTLIVAAMATVSHAGGTKILGGTLEVDGTHTSAITIANSGMLTGIGVVGDLSGTSGSIRPGTSLPGTLTASTATLAGLTFSARLNGPSAGSYDSLHATSADVSNATLNLTLGFAPSHADRFTVVTNAIGTFTGLPEGALYPVNGIPLRLTYHDGSGGHDVVLSVDGAPTISAFTPRSVIADNPIPPIPNTAAVTALLKFFKDDGTTVFFSLPRAPTSHATRTMWWDATHYGAHGEKASAGPALTWYFGEGSQGYFHTYFLLLNPNATANVAHVTYFLEDGAPLLKDHALSPTPRRTVDVSTEPALQNRSFGAQVTFDQPGMAERAMYFGDAPLFNGGTDSAGANAPAATWFLAEGATGTFFDTFILIANPNATAANVTTTYLPASGAPVAKTHVVGAHQRLTINIAEEDPALASAAVGTTVTADQPVIVERSQYWPHGNWYEAHNSAGETAADTKWALAEGRVGGPNRAQTYILLANAGNQPAEVTATFLRDDGTTVAKTFTVAPMSRLNVAVTRPGSDVPELVDENFGTALISTQPIIVERSMYSDANGVVWAAGTNATATRMP